MVQKVQLGKSKSDDNEDDRDDYLADESTLITFVNMNALGDYG